jgi:hypothetical protein
VWPKAVLAVLALVLTGIGAPLQAAAAPKPTIEQVRKRVQELNEQAEAATERYNDLREQITSLNVRLQAAKVKLVAQQKAVARARAELAKVAADTYRAGDLATLALFLSDRPDHYFQANSLLLSLGDRKSSAMDDVLLRQQELVAAVTDVQEQEERLQKARKDLQTTRMEVERKLEEQTALLARLSAQDRARLGQAQAGDERHSLEDLGVKVPGSGKLSCDDVRWHAYGSVAMSRLRLRQRLCCSPAPDLRAAVCDDVETAGVGYAVHYRPPTAPVSSDQLKPGDLVFFHSGLTHVGIYLGKGLMLHAPQTGDVVKIAPMRYNSSFATAVRL